MSLDDAAIGRLRDAADWPDVPGRYRILRRIARGGMGAIFAAEDMELGREVAVKVLADPDLDGELAARLRDEARHLARLEHPGIVAVHDVGTLVDGRPFYVMRLVRGRSLAAFCDEDRSQRELLEVFVKICSAVSFAHAHGVLHRDLKPENVMIGEFGEVLVMDWGVAKRIGDAESGAKGREEPSAANGRTAHGTVIGTPGYMAPEQARGEVDRLDVRTDVFGLGALLHRLLFGRPPASRVAGRASPRALRAIAAMAMADTPADRYASAADLAADVSRYLDGDRVRAYPEGMLLRALRRLQKHRALVLLVLAYLVMRVVVLVATGR